MKGCGPPCRRAASACAHALSSPSDSAGRVARAKVKVKPNTPYTRRISESTPATSSATWCARTSCYLYPQPSHRSHPTHRNRQTDACVHTHTHTHTHTVSLSLCPSLSLAVSLSLSLTHTQAPDLFGCAENVCVVLGKLAHAGQTRQSARHFVPITSIPHVLQSATARPASLHTRPLGGCYGDRERRTDAAGKSRRGARAGRGRTGARGQR
jgi:hypothetical protein